MKYHIKSIINSKLLNAIQEIQACVFSNNKNDKNNININNINYKDNNN